MNRSTWAANTVFSEGDESVDDNDSVVAACFFSIFFLRRDCCTGLSPGMGRWPSPSQELGGGWGGWRGEMPRRVLG